MKTSGWWLAAGGIGGLLLWATLGAEPRGYWAPDGFVERADRIITDGKLTLRCGVQDSILAAFEPGSADERFFRSSYLRADVRRFNDDPTAPRSPFVVEGCELRGVDPFYHRIDLPYNRIPRWTGTLRFDRADQSATLLGGPRQRLQVFHPAQGTGVAENARVDPGDEEALVRAEFLRLQVPWGREVAADFFFVGSGPVLADRRDVGSSARLRLDGYALPPGRMVRLQTGDWIQLEDGREQVTYQVKGADQAEVISATGSAGRGETRQTLVPHVGPFAEALAQAFEAGLQSVPGAQDGGLGSGLDLRLTLDRELELATHEIVDRWCRERLLPDRPRAVSALVMDAFSGAVRAMPSCPGARQLESYPQMPARLRSRHRRNQNLIAHPVGSAAKPFWAAAISTAHPGLMDLEIPAHPDARVSEVFGCPLGQPYGSAAHGDWEGLEDFIRTSCNRYLVELATAALIAGETGTGCEGPDLADCLPAADEERGTPVRLCDRVVHLVLEDGLPFTGESCEDLRLVDADFRPGPGFEGITGVAAYRDRTPTGSGAVGLDEAYRAGRYRLDLWRHPLQALEAVGDTADPTVTALRFAAVSPQVTNLALNTVEELRTDWINLLLGGENSRWTNFQLAESTARLITGRALRGRLVSEVGDLDPGESGPWETVDTAEAPFLPQGVLHSGARRRVLHAMQRVLEPGGTAQRLGNAVDTQRRRILSGPAGDAGYELLAFAKTGTPAVVVPGPMGSLEREGSVLILGVVLVPPEAGGAASRGHGDWITACPIDPTLRERILSIPPAETLAESGALGFTMAVYLDDVDPEGEDGVAAALAAQLLEPLGDHLAAVLETRLAR